MLRLTVLELSLFLLPFALFGLWRLGVSAVGGGEARPTPVLPLSIVGLVLAVAGFILLVTFGEQEGADPTRRYVPPRLEGDHIERGEFTDQETVRGQPGENERPFGEPSDHSDGRGDEDDDETPPD